MSDLLFRNIQGIDDAKAIIRIHELCRELEGSDSGSLEEYHPKLAWYEERITDLDSNDWILAELNGIVVGYGQTRWNWEERDGAHVFFHASWVAAQSREKDIGTQLLGLLEARCRNKAIGTRAASYEFSTGVCDRERYSCDCLESSGYRLAYTS